MGSDTHMPGVFTHATAVLTPTLHTVTQTPHAESTPLKATAPLRQRVVLSIATWNLLAVAVGLERRGGAGWG